MLVAFLIWCAVGILFIALSIYVYFTKKPVFFFANVDPFEVTDAVKYNRSVAKLFFFYGVAFIPLGLPLLSGQNSAWILLSVLGAAFESIAAMIVYTVVIEKKYKK